MCAGAAFCIFEIFCEILQPFWKISQTVIRIFRIACGISRPVSGCELVTALKHDLSMFLSMYSRRVLRWRCRRWTRQSRNKVTKLSVFHKMYFPCFVNRDLMTGRQAYLRVIAQSRRDQARERKPVLPRLFALLHGPVPPLRGFWISVKYPFHLSSSPFCSACALMLRSQPRILFPLGFIKWEPAPLSFLSFFRLE